MKILYKDLKKEALMYCKRFFILLILCGVSLVPVFCGPFGLDMGMSLDQIKQKTGKEPIHTTEDTYIVTPPKKNNLFEGYLVKVHPTYGIYSIAAIGKTIITNGYGLAVITAFDNLVASIKEKYGEYEKIDFLDPKSVFDSPEYFMYTLENGARTLGAIWDREKGSTMPDDIYVIAIFALAESSTLGVITIQYDSINQVKIKEEQNSVF